MINKLVVENLRHRPIRTLLCVFAIGLHVTMILTLVGVSEGTLSDAAQRTRGVGADIVIRPPDSTILSLSGGFSAGLRRFVEAQPHVRNAAGILVQRLGGFDSVNGVDPATFSRLNGGFRVLQGRMFRQNDELVVDDHYARQRGIRVGDTIDLLNHQWRVSGIVQAGMLSRVVVPLGVLQDLTANTGKVSVLYVKVDHPENAAAVMEALKSQMRNYPIYSMEELMAAMTIDNVPMLRSFINLVIGISVIVGFLAVFQNMYTAILERTKEIGILKALGASRGYIMSALLREAGALAVAGSFLGISLTYVTQFVIARVPTPLIQDSVPRWWPIAFGLALCGALLGALYPGLMAAKQDMIEAISFD